MKILIGIIIGFIIFFIGMFISFIKEFFMNNKEIPEKEGNDNLYKPFVDFEDVDLPLEQLEEVDDIVEDWEIISSPTDGQMKQIMSLFKETMKQSSLSKEEAQRIIENGGEFKEVVRNMLWNMAGWRIKPPSNDVSPQKGETGRSLVNKLVIIIIFLSVWGIYQFYPYAKASVIDIWRQWYTTKDIDIKKKEITKPLYGFVTDLRPIAGNNWLLVVKNRKKIYILKCNLKKSADINLLRTEMAGKYIFIINSKLYTYRGPIKARDITLLGMLGLK